MKTDKKTIALLVMGLIIIGGVGVYAYNYISIKNYNYGFNDATLLINQQLLSSLNQDGYINFIYPINETSSIPIKLIPQLNQEVNK